MARPALLLLVLVLAVLGLQVTQPPSAGACGWKVVAVGGVNDGGATVFPPGSVDVRVQYSGGLNAMEEGISALAGTVNSLRRDCAGVRLTLTGHSQGGAIVHVYLSRHGLFNGDAVLFGEPKMHPSGASKDVFAIGGPPVAGVDANFRGVRTVSLCQVRDGVCNSNGDAWVGYAQGEHGRYDFQPRWHAGKTGIIWLR